MSAKDAFKDHYNATQKETDEIFSAAETYKMVILKLRQNFSADLARKASAELKTYDNRLGKINGRGLTAKAQKQAAWLRVSSQTKSLIDTVKDSLETKRIFRDTIRLYDNSRFGVSAEDLFTDILTWQNEAGEIRNSEQIIEARVTLEAAEKWAAQQMRGQIFVREILE